MTIQEKIKKSIEYALLELELPVGGILLEHPNELSHGDYSTNVALMIAKREGKQPREIAEQIRGAIAGNLPEEVEKMEIAGAGFINFYLTKEFFEDSLEKILQEQKDFGKNSLGKNKGFLFTRSKKVMVEYTDPNPFKVFHIGHLMSNAIGESLARLYEYSGANVKRANYFGDVGLHVAKTIYGKLQNPAMAWGEAYAFGAQKYENDEQAQKEIKDINKKVYDQSDKKINQLYAQGRKETMDRFEELYKILGTKFDYYFPESEVAPTGIQIVNEFLEKGIFKASDGAIVFPGENYGLHTRVFLNSQGLPTYEAKDIALNKIKFEKERNLDKSIIITAHEQSEYFKVVFKVLSLIYPKVAEKTEHVAHGMMSGLGGKKMSSRTGDVVTGESLIEDVRQMALEKITASERNISNKEELANQVAVAAIKYSILKQAPGKNIVFDPQQALSFEGDSGPYLQYTYTRARSVLEKAKKEGMFTASVQVAGSTPFPIEHLLYRFPEVTVEGLQNFAPHHLTTYLIELAREFNTFYGNTKIVDGNDKNSPYKIALTKAVSIVLKNGLYLLGIEAPERM